MKRWLVIVIIAAALVVVGGMGWIGYKSSQAQATPPSAPPTTAATVCDVEQTIDLPGSVVNTQVEAFRCQRLAAWRISWSARETMSAAGRYWPTLPTRTRCLRPWQMRTSSYCKLNVHCKMSPPRPRSRRPRPTRPWWTLKKTLDDAKTARYQKNLSRASQATVDSAHASLVIAQDELKRAQENYNQFANRPENDVMRAQAFSRLAATQQKVDQEQANLTWMLAGPDAVEINQADAAIQVAQAQLDVAQSNWERLKTARMRWRFNRPMQTSTWPRHNTRWPRRPTM